MAHKGMKKVHEDNVYGQRIITWNDGLDFYHNPKGTSQMIKIDPRKYCPRAPRGLKEVERPIPDYVYTKLPRMWAWEDEKEPGELKYLRMRFLREAEVFELFRDPENRHPNIATYHGCIVKDGLIRGICMSKYKYTLQDAVDPNYLGKHRFQYGAVPGSRLDCGRTMYETTLMRGLKHLHRLGYAHCDIKPENVMLRKDGTAVVIDFDSCVPIGSDIHKVQVGRTRGWHDPNVRIASERCDFDAVTEIREWLSDRRPHERRYQFP